MDETARTAAGSGTLLARARAFLVRDGRVLEQRLCGALFDADPVDGARAALGAYRNADGGYAHGLEPDKRCPVSLPIDAEAALGVLVTLAGAEPSPGPAPVEAVALCDWFAGVATADGAVSLAFPVIEEYPRAVHWADWTYVPGLNPTAGIAGLLHRLGVRHAWLDRATGWCLDTLERDGWPADAHAVSEVASLLAVLPGRYEERGRALAGALPEALAKAEHYRAEGSDPSYGVTPLHLAPSPDSPWRELFSEERIEGHLDRLLRDQREDGGWALTWEPPSPAATYDYRGVETLRALRVLKAYGRLG